MYPELLKIGNITIQSYGFLMAIGIAVAVIVGIFRGKRRGFHSDSIIDIAIYGVLGGMLGAKLLYLATELPEILKDPSSIGQMLTGGFVVYGAIIGGIIGAYIYCRIKNIDFMRHFDLLVPSLAIAQGIGRLGCFSAGCCYGKRTDGIFHTVFTHSPYAPNGVWLYPTQLISSFGDFFIAAILLVFARRERKTGAVAGLYLVLYSSGRFLVEFLRDDPRGVVGILSTSQFICIFIFAAGVYLLQRDKGRGVEMDRA